VAHQTYRELEPFLRKQPATPDTVEKLADTVFCDSLVNNMVELVDLIPALNFAADPELDQLAQATRDKLANLDPETLQN
jgi:hypothetical protein